MSSRKPPPKPARRPTKRAPPAVPARRGPDAMVEAMRLVAEGYALSTVAAQLGVDRGTVSDWRDSPDGRAALADARKVRADAFKDAAERSRQILREGAERAATVIVDGLEHRDPVVRSLFARTLLDRVGVPRTQRVETNPAPPDTSGLSDEELEQFERLHAKVRGL